MNKNLRGSGVGAFLFLCLLCVGLVAFLLRWTNQPGALPTGQTVATSQATVEVLPSPTPPVVETEQINTQPYPPPPDLSPTPILTPSPTPLPTPTPLPYPHLAVAAIEPVPNGPYLNMLWSPDGTKALITKQINPYLLATDLKTEAKTGTGLGDLWLLDLTNNSEKQLLPQAGRYSWSPNSSKFVYLNPTTAEGIAGLVSIYDVNSSESKPLVAADFLGSDYTPQWLPTDEIVYVRDGLLWSIHADGSGEQQLANFAFVSLFFSWEQKSNDAEQNKVEVGGFHFSPNGKRIAYKTAHENIRTVAHKLWLADADGSNTQLITGQAEGSYYEWSPDGAWLLFNTYRDIDDPNLDERLPPVQGLWVVQADGSNVHAIYRADNWRWLVSPIWSPDNSKVAFIQLEFREGQNPKTDIWLADVNEQAKAAPLTEANQQQDDIHLLWWAPDGMSIFAAKNKSGSDPADNLSESEQIKLIQK